MADVGSFTFVHCADLHLDTPFSGVHESSPEVAAALREASLDAFDAIVELCIEREAAFLLVAGDVYDGAERGLRAQLRFRDGLARLDAEGIATFVVHGNHDPVETSWSAIERWPESVTFFPPRAATIASVERGGTLLATIQGVSYARPAETENLARQFRRPAGPGVHIGLLHCNVEGSPGGHANYAPCTLADLVETGLDYLALGHVHQRRTLRAGGGPGDPWVVYPGNSQARSPRPTEAGPKGALVVEVRDGRIAEPEFVACDRIRFAELPISIAELEDLGELEDLLVARAAAALEAAEGRSLVVRARLSGRGELHGELGRAGVLAELLGHLREGGGSGRAFCWWDELLDASEPALDLDRIRSRGDFAAELLEGFETAGEEVAAEHLERALADLPQRLRRHAEQLLERRGETGALVERARYLALDELERRDR